MTSKLAHYKKEVRRVVLASQVQTAASLMIASLFVANLASSIFNIHFSAFWASYLFGMAVPLLAIAIFICKARRVATTGVVGESGDWLILCIAVGLSPLFPAILAMALLQLQLRYAYQGRFYLVRRVSAMRVLWSFRRASATGYLADLVGSVAAYGLLFTGDSSEGIAVGMLAADHSYRAFQENRAKEAANGFFASNSNYVRLLALHGLFEQARELLPRLLNELQHTSDLPVIYRCIALSQTASAAIALRDDKLALQYAEAASELFTQVNEPRFDLRAFAACLDQELAEANCNVGNFERAEECAHRAVTKWEIAAGEYSIRLAPVYSVLGTVALQRGDVAAAEDAFALAAAIRQVRIGNRDPLLLGCLSGYAKCLEANGSTHEAHEVLQSLALIQPDHHSA
jgi:hypothetical protein